MINLVLLGPPASGKGTQAAKLIEKLGLCHISAGDLLRAEIAAATPLGLSIKDRVESGNLLPDDIVIGVIAKRIRQPDCQKGVLFDGFPRTLGQAQGLDDMLNAQGTPLTLAIELQADEGILIRNMQRRIDTALAKGEAPRKDDNIQTLKHRLYIYNTETVPTIPYHQQHSRHEVVNAVGSIEDVSSSINLVLSAHGIIVPADSAAVQKPLVKSKPEEPQP